MTTSLWCLARRGGGAGRRCNAHAVPFLAPERRPAVLAGAPQDRVPCVQLRIGDAVPHGEGVAKVARLRLGVLVAAGGDAGLCRARRRDGCCRPYTNAVVFAGPEVGRAIGAVESKYGVPCERFTVVSHARVCLASMDLSSRSRGTCFARGHLQA